MRYAESANASYILSRGVLFHSGCPGWIESKSGDAQRADISHLPPHPKECHLSQSLVETFPFNLHPRDQTPEKIERKGARAQGRKALGNSFFASFGQTLI